MEHITDKAVEAKFPELAKAGYRITSPAVRSYNCVAWAANDTERWWWPDSSHLYSYWPSGVDRRLSCASFVTAFATLGYAPCKNGTLEDGLEKVALYVDESGVPTHMARQLEDGAWTSKLGNWYDIRHEAVDGICGKNYGRVWSFLKRPNPFGHGPRDRGDLLGTLGI